MDLNPVFVKIVFLILGIAGSFTLNALIISWQVARKVGQYEEKVQSMQRIFVDRASQQDKTIGDLRYRIEEFIGQIAYLEGKLNGRKIGGNHG